jgi:hypothetical protein
VSPSPEKGQKTVEYLRDGFERNFIHFLLSVFRVTLQSKKNK